MYKKYNLEPPKLRLYQLTQNIATKIAPHIFSAMMDLGMIFHKYIWSRSPILVGVDHAVTSYSWYGTLNEHENTHNNVIEGYIRRDMTVYTDQKYQEKYEAGTKMLCQLKQRYKLNNGHDKMDIPSADGFFMCLATFF